MWKKLQTYLTIAATGLIISMFFSRFAGIIGPEGAIEKIMYYEKTSYLVMMIMLLSACVFSVITHKVPFLQSRVCTLTALMFFGFQIWLGVDFLKYHNEMVFSITMLFPTLGTALEMIAARRAMIDGMTLNAVKNLKGRRKK